MFDYLPLHIRETIFSRVRYVDLFETARVSQEWWTLTMASFDRVLHKDNEFLLDQVDFCNEMMPNEETWQWWMLMEFTKSKQLHLNKDDFDTLINEADRRLIKYFKAKEIIVRDLAIGTEAVTYEDHLKLPPDLTKLFPDLISVNLNGVEFADSSAVVLPANLKVVKMNSVRIPSRTSLSVMLSNPSELYVLRITGLNSDVYFDGLNCQNLTRLSINPTYLFPDDKTQVNSILRSIVSQNKRLKSISLFYASIDKEWLQMFPFNVVELELKHPHLCLDLIELFGDNVLYERMELFYIFENWKSVVNFKSWEMFWLINDITKRNYQIRYVCKPTTKSEAIEIYRKSRRLDFNDLISRNKQDIELTTLKYGGDHFCFEVPQSVRSLNVGWPDNPVGTLVLEDPSVLETLYLNTRHSSVINLYYVKNMINLRKLEIWNCDSRVLACILVFCTLLMHLKLGRSDFHMFREIASDIQSVSLKHLTILDGKDTFANILRHLPSLNKLDLNGHSETAILQSDVKAVGHLKYFKAEVKSSKNVAAHLGSLEFPHMIFACSDFVDVYVASKGMKFMNENIHLNAERSFSFKSYRNSIWVNREMLSLVYSKNVSTRFLRNSCVVVNTVHDFIA